MPSLTREIDPKGDLHKFIIAEVRRRVKLSEKELGNKRQEWDNSEEQVLAYMSEEDADVKRRKKRENEGKPQYTTIKIPYTYGVLLSSWTYWSTVFFSRDPVFQLSGRHGEAENQTQALEALIGYQVLVGQMMPILYSWLYDAGRYGCGIVGSYWDEEINMITTIAYEAPSQPDPNDPLAAMEALAPQEPIKMQKTVEMGGYKGNKLWNINPKDFLFDPRLTIRDFQKGEYCGVRHRLSWEQIKRREKQGYYMNVDEINPSIVPRFQDEFRDDTTALERPTDYVQDNEYASESFGDKKVKYPTQVPVYECYIKISPSDWHLGNSDYPEIWIFTVTADLKCVIGCSPLGLYHNSYPFDIVEMEADAYALVNRGQPQILESVQNTMDWLLNSHFYNVRASLNNLFVVDPTKVVMKDITDPLPGGVIRLKPGWDIGMSQGKQAIQQLPIQDITRSHLVDMQQMLGIGERVSGVNDQIMGVLNQAAGRKTATEVRQSSTFGANRQKTITEYMSACGFAPLCGKLVSNSQQFYDGDLKLKLVGSLASLAGTKFMEVNPENIAGKYDFIPVDGTLPVDRFAQANLWKDMLMNLKQFPQLLQQLDLFKLFSWIANLAGLRNIDTFRIQVMPQGAGAPPGMVPVMGGGGPQMSQGPGPGMINGPGNGAPGGMGPIATGTGVGQ